MPSANSTTGFPVEGLASAIRTGGRPSQFDTGEVEDLLDYKYGNAYAFAVLALLYPTLDFRNRFHQDHIHPRSHFSRAQLHRRGIAAEQQPFYMANVDRLPNLQLLEGMPNLEKSNTPFADWLREKYSDPEKRRNYMERNYIPDTDAALTGFREFYDARRELMLRALRKKLGVSPEATASASSDRRRRRDSRIRRRSDDFLACCRQPRTIVRHVTGDSILYLA